MKAAPTALLSFFRMGTFLLLLMRSSDFCLGSIGELFGSFPRARLIPRWRGAHSKWHTAAELVRKDLIKRFCGKKCQLVKIPTVCREELGSPKVLSGKFLWRVCTRTGLCVCVCDPVLAGSLALTICIWRGRDFFFFWGKAALVWIWICKSIGAWCFFLPPQTRFYS